MTTPKHSLINTLKLLIGALILSFGISYVYAWVGPTQTPPNGNVLAPVNIADTSQIKEGNLTLNSLGNFVNGLLVPFGNVGIGTANPGAKLHVAGDIRIDATATTDSLNVGSSAGWFSLNVGGTFYWVQMFNAAGVERVYTNTKTPQGNPLTTNQDFRAGPGPACQRLGYSLGSTGAYACGTITLDPGMQSCSPPILDWKRNSVWRTINTFSGGGPYGGSPSCNGYGENWCNNSNQYLEWIDCKIDI
ncbi:MAG: hypothetical protein BMS9Abin13_311 [Patescibacteria group bacterium]|nr:MAG: hypothetical protein BMS9Abin13_311 [Patescibacteria group bacterium]